MSTLAPRSSRAVTLSSPRSWLRSRLEVLLGHVFYGKRKQDRCSTYHNLLDTAIGRILLCTTSTSLQHSWVCTQRRTTRDRWSSPASGSELFATVLASGEECRVFPLFWCASNQARRCLFKRAGALSIGCNTPYYTQLLVLLSRLLLKHTSAHRANTTARDIPLSRAFTQHLYLLWQFSQCTIYLKL